MRYTIIITRGLAGWSAAVPAMPGCFAQGGSRDEVIEEARGAMRFWLESEADAGRGPLEDSPRVIADGVAEAIEILREMRQVGELPVEAEDQVELVSIELRQPATV